jgi:hypothetical protein
MAKVLRIKAFEPGHSKADAYACFFRFFLLCNLVHPKK